MIPTKEVSFIKLATLTTFCVGGVVAAIDQRSGIESIAAALELVRAKFLITHPETLENALAAAESIGLPTENILLFGDQSIKGIQAVDQVLFSGEELGTPYPYTLQQIKNDPTYLYFTSGTTGAKKAVILTQSIIITIMSIKDIMVHVGTHTLVYTDFHHMSALIVGVHMPIHAGCTAYVMPQYTFEGICAAIQTYKIYFIATQPYMISALAKDDTAKKYDLSSLRVVSNGGAALELTVTLIAKENIGLRVVNLYGMTESLGAFDNGITGTMLNGIGHLAFGFKAKLVDKEGNEVPQGEVGELLIKGPTVTPGYYGNPKATAEAIDTEGYLHTGDLLKCNKDGFFAYMGRSNDLIKYHLTHIHPTSIESVLMAHPKVADCAVIGVYSHEILTELPRAYILLNNGERHSEDIVRELEEYSNNQLADEMRLRGGIIIVDSFPRTPSGKIQRRFLNPDVNA